MDSLWNYRGVSFTLTYHLSHETTVKQILVLMFWTFKIGLEFWLHRLWWPGRLKVNELLGERWQKAMGKYEYDLFNGNFQIGKKIASNVYFPELAAWAWPKSDETTANAINKCCLTLPCRPIRSLPVSTQGNEVLHSQWHGAEVCSSAFWCQPAHGNLLQVCPGEGRVFCRSRWGSSPHHSPIMGKVDGDGSQVAHPHWEVSCTWAVRHRGCGAGVDELAIPLTYESSLFGGTDEVEQTSKDTSEASDPLYTALLGRIVRKLCIKLIQYLQTEVDVEHWGRVMPIAEDPYDRPSAPSFTDKKVCCYRDDLPGLVEGRCSNSNDR